MAMFSTYDQIINSVRSSNLNFAHYETPFSIYLTIRKSQVKNYHHHEQGLHPCSSEVSASSIGRQNKELVKETSFKESIRDLEGKLDDSEAEVLKAYDQIRKSKEHLSKKDDEIKSLKIKSLESLLILGFPDLASFSSCFIFLLRVFLSFLSLLTSSFNAFMD